MLLEAHRTKTRRLEAGERLFSQGQATDGIYFIDSGVVRLETANLSLMRQFRVGTHRLDFGIDALNPFNFVRWNDPNTNISSGAQFGSVTGTQGARTVQLNISYAF